MLSHVQHMTKILVGLSQDTPGERIYSNKEFSQLLKFLRGFLISTRTFQKRTVFRVRVFVISGDQEETNRVERDNECCEGEGVVSEVSLMILLQ